MKNLNGNRVKNAGSNIINNAHTPVMQKQKVQNITNKKKPTSSMTNNRNNIIYAGNGLWCEAKKNEEDKPYVSIIPQLEKERNELLLDPEKEANQKLISQLKHQVKELTTQLQKEMAKSYDAEFRANHAENNKKNIMDMFESKNQEYKELIDEKNQMENSINTLNEALNNAKKEIMRLNGLLYSESEKNKELNEQLQNFMIEKERNNYMNSTNMNGLNKQIEQLNKEKENLIKILNDRKSQTKNEENTNTEFIQNKLNEKDRILKSMETTMNKALNENEELKKKLSTSEASVNKLNDIISKKNDKNKQLEDKIKGLQEYIDSFGKEVKWNQNQIAQKENAVKLMKDKLKKKDEEISNLQKKIEELNKKVKAKIQVIENKNEQNDNDDDGKEILIPVKAKPTLFGPEKKEKEKEKENKGINFYEEKNNKKPFLFGPETYSQEDYELDQVIFNS